MRESLVYKGLVAPISEDGNLWVSAQQIAHIVGVASRTAREHLTTLEGLGRITQPKNCRYFPITKQEGENRVTRGVKHYTPRVVMRVAFRSNSEQALDFQEWAIDTLRKLQCDGVVYRDEETKALAMQQASDRKELFALRGEVAQLRAENKQLQGIIDECLTDMNEGRVPWFGGALPKRVTYLIGAQKGARPQAPQLESVTVTNNVLIPTPDKERVLGLIARYAQRTGRPPSTSDVRTMTGRSTAARMKKEDVQELIDELVEEGCVEEVRLNEGKIRRWRKA